MASFDLSGSEVALLAAAVAASGLWLLVAGAVYALRRPPRPPVGPTTLDLGPEPPAVANFLVNDFRVTAEALPATLIDLAARDLVDVEQRGPGVYYLRLRPSSDEPLAPYERQVLDHLRRRAHDGVVPAQALTTGPSEVSARWRRIFEGSVVVDAKARGLSRDAIDGPAFGALTLASAVPTLLAWALGGLEAGILVIGAALGVLGWIRARHPQRETPEGLAAATRWLGVRAELGENEVFRTHSPLTVEIWDRLLAYGAALGVAAGASRPLPLGVESDTRAWSSHGGRWRPVHVSYPRRWPVGWGHEPGFALLVAGVAVVGGALSLYAVGPALLDPLGSGWIGVMSGSVLLASSLAVVVGVAVAIMAWSDQGDTVEITGPILRLRSFGNDEKRRHYVAVDDGDARAIRAWRVSPRLYATLEQGDVVTASVTRNLGCVRALYRSSGTQDAMVGDE